MQLDFDAVTVNPISSTTLKWLTFKVVSWRHDFQPRTTNGLGLLNCCVIIGIDCWDILVHHIQSLASVTMATIACSLL
jgi:hypothetical protein